MKKVELSPDEWRQISSTNATIQNGGVGKPIQLYIGDPAPIDDTISFTVRHSELFYLPADSPIWAKGAGWVYVSEVS
jgi:hypothetical protein